MHARDNGCRRYRDSRWRSGELGGGNKGRWVDGDIGEMGGGEHGDIG